MSKEFKLFSSVFVNEALSHNEVKSKLQKSGELFYKDHPNLEQGFNNFISEFMKLIDALQNVKKIETVDFENGFEIKIDFTYIETTIEVVFEEWPSTEVIAFIIRSNVKDKYVAEHSEILNGGNTEKLRRSIDNDYGLDIAFYNNTAAIKGNIHLAKISSYLTCTDQLAKWFIDTSFSTGVNKFYKVGKMVAYDSGSTLDVAWLPACGYFCPDAAGDKNTMEFKHATI